MNSSCTPHRPLYCPDNIQNWFSSNLPLDGPGHVQVSLKQNISTSLGDMYEVTLNTQAKQDMYIIRMTAMKRMSRMAVVPKADSMVIWTGMWWTPLEPSADKIVLVMLKS